jgi:hypothetical protein
VDGTPRLPALEGAFHMARLFRVNSVNSDGTEAAERLIEFEVIDPTTSKPFMEDGKPSVVITLRPISPAKYRQVVAEHTERQWQKKSRAMEEITDWDAVQDALVVYTIRDWRGIIGADEHPLQCVLDAKLALPGDLKNELVQRAMQGDAVEQAASFRPAS